MIFWLSLTFALAFHVLILNICRCLIILWIRSQDRWLQRDRFIFSWLPADKSSDSNWRFCLTVARMRNPFISGEFEFVVYPVHANLLLPKFEGTHESEIRADMLTLHLDFAASLGIRNSFWFHKVTDHRGAASWDSVYAVDEHHTIVTTFWAWIRLRNFSLL